MDIVTDTSDTVKYLGTRGVGLVDAVGETIARSDSASCADTVFSILYHWTVLCYTWRESSLQKVGFTVNAIVPGPIATEAWLKTLFADWGSQENIPKVFRLLCSDEYSWVAGQILMAIGAAVVPTSMLELSMDVNVHSTIHPRSSALVMMASLDNLRDCPYIKNNMTYKKDLRN
ncbi:hypothetical protein TSTA_059370 [Talaromyces stipitatus ATCC 10500]|uniref:Uncharacterized protein n=1 Tax=Talaromyces stipitatus (strain ATCC 10500 / CBS 375.48 / QM 6759 / NRRL 1006) TaxID=441959 RepID=B8MQM8_TALSN|nr:uncharacterized protein TSTA_059370 [Talaromyces stipitatus ATCC 10500]EED13451.1 hypothetical protein TSTA_059370 [Talaromyces stipitatus ATCC 10500]